MQKQKSKKTKSPVNQHILPQPPRTRNTPPCLNPLSSGAPVSKGKRCLSFSFQKASEDQFGFEMWGRFSNETASCPCAPESGPGGEIKAPRYPLSALSKDERKDTPRQYARGAGKQVAPHCATSDVMQMSTGTMHSVGGNGYPEQP